MSAQDEEKSAGGTGQVLQIAGIDVDFPFVPYPCQVDFMARVIACLDGAQNGLLESPTGTGKTLCLLCAALSWLRAQRARGAPGASRLVYASRTHGQLAQVVHELRRTAFAGTVRATVVGSRAQLCIHSAVSRLRANHAAQNRLCSALAGGSGRSGAGPARTCPFRERLNARLQGYEAAALPLPVRVPEGKKEEEEETPELDSILDVEDLVKYGRAAGVCPYYLSRRLVATGDVAGRAAFARAGREDMELVLLPYNYLLDARARESTGVDLADAAVIFDEAHNLDGSCADVASSDLAAADVAFCRAALDRGLGTALDAEDPTGTGAGTVAGVRAFLTALERGVAAEARAATVRAHKTVVRGGDARLRGVAIPGSWIHELCRAEGIDAPALSVLAAAVDRLAQLAEDANADVDADGDVSATTSSSANAGGNFHNGFEALGQVLRAVAATPAARADACFRIYIEECGVEIDPARAGYVPLELRPVAAWRLGFWCFSPAVALAALTAEHGVRCIVLASGTLAPFDALESELGVAFPVRLENPHVVPRSSIWAGVLPRAATGAPLNSSFKTAARPEYVWGIGHTLVNIMRVVPAGVLVFFPSYTLLARCLDCWHTREPGAAETLWAQIEREKAIFVEPRYTSQLAAQIAQYHQTILATTTTAVGDAGGGAGSTNGTRGQTGATFFAVARGKVSEGIDFAGDNARAVVVIGLPFPNKADPRVHLKWAFLDNAQREAGGAPPAPSNSNDSPGAKWYSQQAMRAVNQSVGRVIRNIHDYGAIVLCDERYMDPQLQGMLSAWMRPCVQGMRNFGQLSASLATFFRQKHEASLQPQPSQTPNQQQQQQQEQHSKDEKTKEPAPQQQQSESKPSGKSYLLAVCISLSPSMHTHT